MVKIRNIVKISLTMVLLMNVCGIASAVTAQEQRQLVDAWQIHECNPKWNVGVRSDSANFESLNEFFMWHISDKHNIMVRELNGSIKTETFYELAGDYSVHLFTSKNERFVTDGSLNSNVDEIQYQYLRGHQF